MASEYAKTWKTLITPEFGYTLPSIDIINKYQDNYVDFKTAMAVLGRNTLRVYFAYSALRDKFTCCAWPSDDYLADKLNLSRRTIQNCKRKLESFYLTGKPIKNLHFEYNKIIHFVPTTGALLENRLYAPQKAVEALRRAYPFADPQKAAVGFSRGLRKRTRKQRIADFAREQIQKLKKRKKKSKTPTQLLIEKRLKEMRKEHKRRMKEQEKKSNQPSIVLPKKKFVPITRLDDDFLPESVCKVPKTSASTAFSAPVCNESGQERRPSQRFGDLHTIPLSSIRGLKSNLLRERVLRTLPLRRLLRALKLRIVINKGNQEGNRSVFEEILDQAIGKFRSLGTQLEHACGVQPLRACGAPGLTPGFCFSEPVYPGIQSSDGFSFSGTGKKFNPDFWNSLIRNKTVPPQPRMDLFPEVYENPGYILPSDCSEPVSVSLVLKAWRKFRKECTNKKCFEHTKEIPVSLRNQILDFVDAYRSSDCCSVPIEKWFHFRNSQWNSRRSNQNKKMPIKYALAIDFISNPQRQRWFLDFVGEVRKPQLLVSPELEMFFKTYEKMKTQILISFDSGSPPAEIKAVAKRYFPNWSNSVEIAKQGQYKLSAVLKMED